MEFNRSCFVAFFVVVVMIICICIPSVTPQACQKICGSVPIKYPFGSGPGCGDPRFQPFVTCNNQQQLTFSTRSGCYPITSIDYNSQVMFVSDPSMSTCACQQPSKGFSLDWNAPFSFHDDTVFALLGCSSTSTSSSSSPFPMFKSTDDNNSSTSSFPMCDSNGAEVCQMLYTCRAMSRVNIPVSSCCVYSPVDLGPSFEMDLEKLQCTSYSGLYGFNGQDQSNPGAWKYGVGLKYKFSFDNRYPTMCANCEKSNGVCGYDGPYDSYICNCRHGLNTSSDCFFGASWSGGLRFFPFQTGILLTYGLAWIFVLAVV